MEHGESVEWFGAAETEEFMAIAAHDLRNPIAVVRASAQMAQRQLARGDLALAGGRLNAIVEQTDRLADMLETFLDAARIGANRLALRRERVDLRELVEAAVQRVRVGIGEFATREVETDVPPDCIGSWDRPRVERAVRALLSNAFTYGLATAPVTLRAVREGAHVRVSVSGGGPGPDAEETTHLFERFYRGKSAADAGTGGSGLGLFTARGIARVHGGDVRHIARDVFEITLPLEAT